MRTDVTDALAQLRRSDPARDLAPGDVDAALAGVPRAAVPPGRRPYRRAAMVLAAAAVAAVAVVSAALVRSSDQEPVAAPTAVVSDPPRPSQSTNPPSTTNLDVTRAVVERLLASRTLVPGSSRVERPPAGMPTAPFMSLGLQNLVRDSALYLAPGTAAAASAYLKAHPPAGMVLSVTSSASGRNSHGTLLGVAFSAGRGIVATRTQSPELIYTIAPLAKGVAIRIDAQAVWVPDRPAGSMIGRVRSVDVVVDRRGSPPTVRRTLTGKAAQHLADEIDALTVQTPGGRFCPIDRGSTDDLVFHTPNRTVHVVDHIGGCQNVTVDIAAPVVLDGNVDPAVRAALGLPATYAR